MSDQPARPPSDPSDDGYFVTLRPEAPTGPPPGDGLARPPTRAGARKVGLGTLVVPAVAFVALVVTLTAVLLSGSAGAPTAGDTPAAVAVNPGTRAQPDPYVGPGEFAMWVTNDDGTPVRWNACEPIHWMLNAADAPPTALPDLQTGFARLTTHTGLEFVYEGTTDEVASLAREPYQRDRYGDRWAPVLVSWVAPDDAFAVTSHDRAATIPVAVDEGDGSVFVTAQVLFNRDRDLLGGYTNRQDHWGGTILHELGHLVGLDHVDDAGELMYSRPGLGPVMFGPGDRAGLERLGADAGCLASPTPQPVDVEYSNLG